MRLRLLSVLLLAAPLACARTETSGFPQGTDLQTSTAGATSTGGASTTATSTSSTGATGTVGTTTGGATSTGTTTSGAGGECASCSGPADCQSGLQCLGGRRGGLCVAACDSAGGCADASLQCVAGYCFPRDFCLGSTGTSGTVGTSGTSGCDLQTCFGDCSALGLSCDLTTCTCQGGTSGTTGSCDLQTCFTACSALNQLCDPSTCTCQGGATSGTSGTTGSCDLQTCFSVCASANAVCDPSTCACQGGGTSGTVGTSGTSSGCDLQGCYTTCAAQNELCDPTTCTCQGSVSTSTSGTSGTTGSCDLQSCYANCAVLNALCDPNTCTCQTGGTSGTVGTSGTTGTCDLQVCESACGPVGGVCDPATCTCSVGNGTGGSSGTVSSGGTSGTGSSTSGTTTGGGDCRSTGCPYGEACTQFGNFNNAYYACACSPASSSGSDSCAGNPSGQDICDQFSLQCRYGKDYDPCNPSMNVQQCASGYGCTATTSTTGVCLQQCASSSDCSAAFTTCAGGTCVADRCGPGTGNGDYYQPCTLATANDGYCEPLPDGDGGVTAYCIYAGSTQVGSSCPGLTTDRVDQCVAGAICLPRNRALPDGGADARCFLTCNASFNPGNYTKSCSGFSACNADQRGLRQSNPDPGICFP